MFNLAPRPRPRSRPRLKRGQDSFSKGGRIHISNLGLRKQVLAFRTLPRAHLAHSFWRFDFSRTLGGAPSRAQRYLQSPLGASKSNLGLRKQVLALRTLPRAHLAHSFWRPDFCRILGGAPSRAQRYLQSPLGASKSNLGLRKQVLAFRTLPRAHLAHSFWRPDFCRILGGAPSRAQRYLQSPLGASKSNLGLRKQVFAFRTLPRAHLAHSFLRLDSSRILRGALPSVSLQKKARFAPPFCLHVKIKRASRSPPSASFKKEMVLRTSLCFNFFFF